MGDAIAVGVGVTGKVRSGSAEWSTTGPYRLANPGSNDVSDTWPDTGERRTGWFVADGRPGRTPMQPPGSTPV